MTLTDYLVLWCFLTGVLFLYLLIGTFVYNNWSRTKDATLPALPVTWALVTATIKTLWSWPLTAWRVRNKKAV